jgi:hypothetical protein
MDKTESKSDDEHGNSQSIEKGAESQTKRPALTVLAQLLIGTCLLRSLKMKSDDDVNSITFTECKGNENNYFVHELSYAIGVVIDMGSG